MVLDSQRDRADRILLPMAKRLQHVNPNTLSWMAFLCAVFAGVNFWLGTIWTLLFAFIFLFLNGLLDALDGMVAKMTGKASVRGDFLDHVLDRYADIFIVGGIMLSPTYNSVLAFLAIIGVLMTSYLGTQSMAVGAGRDYGGILGRADRLVILMLFCLIQMFASSIGYAYVSFGEFSLNFIDMAMIVFAVGGNATAIQRAIRTWRKL
ncbi:MAG: CDP-alcohol phosphatidyltransferase family protein [Thermoplasmata archaeon]|nr:CDP-alcohol phosphatidyltransferase family protein [Thermoplasmata archaeon]